MANASKALIIAGGILIAIFIISLSVYMLSSARGVADASEQRILASQIESFNRFFVSYPNKITGLDVYNILGKIDDINNDVNSIADAPKVKSGPSNKNAINKTVDFKTIYNYSYDYGSNGAVEYVSFY